MRYLTFYVCGAHPMFENFCNANILGLTRVKCMEIISVCGAPQNWVNFQLRIMTEHSVHENFGVMGCHIISHVNFGKQGLFVVI